MARYKTLLATLALVSLVFVGGGKALADDAEPTVDEMKKATQNIIATLRVLRDNGETSLRAAKAAKQMDRMDCVNEALIALKGVLKLAEDYGYDLDAAAKQSDGPGVKRHFKQLNFAKKKVEDLDARVRSCGGPLDDGIVEGEPNIEKLFDADLPNQDPIQGLESDSMFVSKPNSISPWN